MRKEERGWDFDDIEGEAGELVYLSNNFQGERWMRWRDIHCIV